MWLGADDAPIEMVDTNWPKPWMFFRLLMALVIAALTLYSVWYFTGQDESNCCRLSCSFSVRDAAGCAGFHVRDEHAAHVSVIQLGKLFL